MRTRTRITPATSTTYNAVYRQAYNNGVPNGAASLQTSKTVRSSWGTEVILDDPSPGRGVKSVNHSILSGSTNNTSYSNYGNPSVGAYYVFTGSGAMWVNYANELGVGFSSSPSRNRSSYPLGASFNRTEAQLIADAVHGFYSDNSVDSLLNVIEAPQLISSLSALQATLSNKSLRTRILDSLLIKQGRRLVPLGVISGSIISDKQRKLLSGIFGKYGKRIPGVYLAYSFGIAPLISDIRKVDKAMGTLRSQVKAALKSEGRLVSVHRKDTGRLSYRSTLGVDLGSSYQDGHTKWSLTNSTCDRIVTVRGIRSHKYSDSRFSEFDYLLRRFGATGPASLGWELIPFSFVLDWFVDLRNITDRLDNLLTGSTKQIKDVCVSTKYDTTSYCTWNSGSYTLDNGTLLYTEREKNYHRDPVTSYNIVGSSGRFGKKQAALLGALIHQTVANLLSK